MISDAAQSSRLDRQEAEHKELLGKERDLTAGQMMRLEAVSTNTFIMTQEQNIMSTMMMVIIILLSDGDRP